MATLKRFNDRYAELLTEQSMHTLFKGGDTFADAARNLIKFILRIDRIKAFVSEDEINSTIEKAIKVSEDYLNAAAESGKPVKLTNIRSKETFNGTVTKNGAKFKVVNNNDYFKTEIRQGMALAPEAAKMLFEISTNARRSAYQKEQDAATKRAADEKKEKDESEALMQKPEFAAFKDEVKKAGFGDALGSGLVIGRGVPQEFYDLFAKQTPEVKRAFIQYVKNYSVYDPNMEYAESPQWGIENREYEERKGVKSAFIYKLTQLLK